MINLGQHSSVWINLLHSRGLKKLGYGRFLSVSRYRMRKGLPAAPSAEGPLTDGPDWSYPDGTPGLMNKGQSLRYMRDQDIGRTIVKYGKQFEEILKKRGANQAQIDKQ